MTHSSSVQTGTSSTFGCGSAALCLLGPFPFSCGLRRWESHDKAGTLAGTVAFGRYRSLMQGHKILDNRQAEAYPGVRFNVLAVALPERLKDIWQFLFTDADSIIANADFGYCRAIFGRDSDLAVGGGEPDGIGQQVPENLPQTLLVAPDREGLL